VPFRRGCRAQWRAVESLNGILILMPNLWSVKYIDLLRRKEPILPASAEAYIWAGFWRLIMNNHPPAVVAGLDGTEDVLLPLSQHAQNTLFSIARLAPGMTLKVSPFCHENPNGTHEVRGWVLNVPPTAPSSALPINCSLFDGVSLAECECSEAQVLQLLSQPQDTRKRLGAAIDMIMNDSQVRQLGKLALR